LEFFKTINLSKFANFWGEMRQIVDISKLETEKPKKKEKKKPMSNVISFQKEKATGSGEKQTNENGKRKIRCDTCTDRCELCSARSGGFSAREIETPAWVAEQLQS
jgi:hypothetical protein